MSDKKEELKTETKEQDTQNVISVLKVDELNIGAWTITVNENKDLVWMCDGEVLISYPHPDNQ